MPRNYGDFGDTGLEKATAPRDSGRELEKLARVLEQLQENAGSLSKTELFVLQQQVGLRVAEFNRGLLRAIEGSK